MQPHTAVDGEKDATEMGGRAIGYTSDGSNASPKMLVEPRARGSIRERGDADDLHPSTPEGSGSGRRLRDPHEPRCGPGALAPAEALAGGEAGADQGTRSRIGAEEAETVAAGADGRVGACGLEGAEPLGAEPLKAQRLAERGGFEPPVEVYPLQQISNLSCSATPAPLRMRRHRRNAPRGGPRFARLA